MIRFWTQKKPFLNSYLLFLVAGTDTSSTALEWEMSLLLDHPSAMEKVRVEIDANVGQLDKAAFWMNKTLPKLHYLQNVISQKFFSYHGSILSDPSLHL